MKKIKIILFMFISLSCYSYEYPYTDPYVATVLATPQSDMPVFKEIDYKEIKIKLNNGEVPSNLWYLETFKFGLMAQEKKAPLVFLFAGTGSKYNSSKMVTMSRILYEKGFSVIMLPTSFDYNYIVNVSKTHAPGYLKKDSEEIYELMKVVLDKIKDKVEYDRLIVTGYSLGGTTALTIGEIDSRKKYFNFDKVLGINPTVNLYESAVLLDNLLDKNITSEKELEKLMNRVILEILKFSSEKGNVKMDQSSIYALFKKLNLKEDDLETLIGIAFRLIAIDVNYITDILTKSGVYSDPTKEVTKYESMTQYYKAINYSDFQDYIERIGYKTYNKMDKNLTLDQMIKESSLESITPYLKSEKNIAVITNEDEIILTKSNLNYLKSTLKDKLKVYPHGGHCGNMFYKENIDYMIKFFLRGDEK